MVPTRYYYILTVLLAVLKSTGAASISLCNTFAISVVSKKIATGMHCYTRAL